MKHLKMQIVLLFLVFSIAVPAVAQSVATYDPPEDHNQQAILVEHPNERIDLFTGLLRLNVVDIRIPTSDGNAVQIERYLRESYGAGGAQYGFLGIDWTMHFGRLRVGTTTVPAAGQKTPCQYSSASSLFEAAFELPNGDTMTFKPTDTTTTIPGGGGQFISGSGWRLQCQSTIATAPSPILGTYWTFVVTSPGGVKYILDQTDGSYAYASRIVSPNGNTTTIAYQALYITVNGVNITNLAPASISNSEDGKTWLTFAYNGLYLVSITSPSDGKVWSYGYVKATSPPSGIVDNNLHLQTVTRPDGNTWQYAYYDDWYSPDPPAVPAYGPASVSQIKTVTYPTGGSITYTYGWNSISLSASSNVNTILVPGVAKKASSDSGTWAFTYQYASMGSGALDVTTVVTPSKRIVAKHYGWPATPVTTSACWKRGLMDSQYIYDLSTSALVQSVQNTWQGGAVINAFTEYAQGGPVTPVELCAGTQIPVATTTATTRDGVQLVRIASNFTGFGHPQQIVEQGTDSSTGQAASRTLQFTYSDDLARWFIQRESTSTIVGVGGSSRSYDPTSGYVSVESKYGVLTEYSYDANGNLSTVTSPRNFQHLLSQYVRGQPQSESIQVDQYSSDNVIKTRVINVDGTVASKSEYATPGGAAITTSYGYDGVGRVVHIVPPERNPISIFYPSPNNSKLLLRGGYQQITSYDGFGRPTAVQEMPAGSATAATFRSWRYDPTGRKIFESYQNSGNGDTYSYDALDRLIGVTHGDSPATKTSVAHPTGTNTEVFTDENGAVTTRFYRTYFDPREQVLTGLRVANSAGQVVMTSSVQYDAAGHLLSISEGTATDPGGVQKRSYYYDSYFHLVGVIDPELPTVVPGTSYSTLYGRDLSGNMTTSQTGVSGQTGYNYDGLERLVETNYPAASGMSSVVQSWDGLNRLSSATHADNHTAVSYVYDLNGTLQSESLTIPALSSNPVTFFYGYDANDALACTQYPYAGTLIQYNPDWRALPTAAWPVVSSVGFYADARMQSAIFGNGVSTNWTEGDARQRLTAIQTRGSGTFVNLLYTYDGANNVSAKGDSANSVAGSQSYGYDAANRLISVNVSGIQYPLTYDGVDNIRTQTLGGNLSYGYDVVTNRLASAGGIRAYGAFGYDNYGNVNFNGLNKFSWDDASHLVKTYNASGGAISTFGYDARGMRYLLTSALLGTSTYEMYDKAGRLALEWSPASNTRHEHFYLGGQRVAERSGPWVGGGVSNLETNGCQAFSVQGGISETLSNAVQVTGSARRIATGAAVTVSVSVLGSPISGAISLYDGGKLVGTVNVANGVAAFNTGALGFGIHYFNAVYNGPQGLLGSALGSQWIVVVGNADAVIQSIINNILLQ